MTLNHIALNRTATESTLNHIVLSAESFQIKMAPIRIVYK